MSEDTRRGWLVTIGCAGLGLGIAEHAPADGPPVARLPAGLYGPSSEHLGHALMSAEPYRHIPAGCPTDYVSPRNGPFTPLFFTPDEFAVIRTLVQLVLGEPSPTSGGVLQEVAEWIDLQVMSAGAIRVAAGRLDHLSRVLATACYGDDRTQELQRANPETMCRDGLKWLENAAQQSYGRAFLTLPTGQQVAILDAISDGRVDNHEQNAGTQFFTYLKTQTVKGFYTSQVGLKELDFKGNAFYARSPGCDNKKP